MTSRFRCVAAGVAAPLLVWGCGGAAPPPEGNFSQVVWKTSTPVAARAADLGACRALSVGTDPAASPDTIRRATESAAPRAADAALRRCLVSRGYTIADLPWCTPADKAAGPLRRLSATESLPPLDAVRCYAPDIDGFVAA